MKIYYAHSRTIYGTDREREERDFIAKVFPGHSVTCPNRDMGELGAIELYLQAVRQHGMVICSEIEYGDVSAVGIGVFSEVQEAILHGIPVLVLRDHRLAKVKGAYVCPHGDDIHYGQLITYWTIHDTDGKTNMVSDPAWTMPEVTALVETAKRLGLSPRKAVRVLSTAPRIRSRLADMLLCDRHEIQSADRGDKF